MLRMLFFFLFDAREREEGGGGDGGCGIDIDTNLPAHTHTHDGELGFTTVYVYEAFFLVRICGYHNALWGRTIPSLPTTWPI